MSRPHPTRRDRRSPLGSPEGRISTARSGGRPLTGWGLGRAGAGFRPAAGLWGREPRNGAAHRAAKRAAAEERRARFAEVEKADPQVT
jgi:hypothetical protein